MNRTQKLCSAVGFAMKAGKLKTGDFAVEKLVRAGKAQLVLIDRDASENTRRKYTRLCESTRTQCCFIPQLGSSIGKPGRMLAAVIDKNFSDMIRGAYACAAPEDSNDRG